MKRNSLLSAAAFLSLLLLIPSCASIGNPSGGPRDEDPPRFIGATPYQGAVNFTGNKAVLHFDELINVKDAFNKVVVSPPSGSTPRVSSLGRRITVEFQDTLLPNTTYTVDFGDAIEDNNEGNQLQNFIYTFSTGSVLDTLMISGMVLGAEDLEPQQGMLVGLHSNLADSAFRTLRFDRIAKTDDRGRFVIGGLPAGEYRIFALTDPDNDLKYSSPEEELAFYDVVLTPTTERVMTTDSIYDILTGVVDSVVYRERTRYLPNNILLRSFNSGFKPQYITTYERPDSLRLSFIFNSPADSRPTFTLLDKGFEGLEAAEWSVIENSAGNDSITLWLADPRLLSTDTLRVAVGYRRGPTPNSMDDVVDTLRIITKKLPAVKKPKKKSDSDQQIEVPALQVRIPSAVEIDRPLRLELEAPAEEFDNTKWTLEIKNDTVWEKTVLPPITRDSLNPRYYFIDIPWEYDTQYRLRTDSASVRSIYGHVNKETSQEFRTRSDREYSSLTINIGGYNDTIPAYVDLLDGGGKIKRSQPVVGGRVTFTNLLAGKYYLRLMIDRNGDGRYTPGDYDALLQPDYSYYYPRAINLKQNWSQELTWDVFATPVNQMKPYSLLQNKPKLKKGERPPQEDTEGEN